MDIIKCALQHFVGDFARLLHAVHNLMRKYSIIHRCPQAIERPQNMNDIAQRARRANCLVLTTAWVA